MLTHITRRHWSSWAPYAAAAWSLGYGLLAVLWSLGLPGYPFGEGDIPAARDESMLGSTTAGGAAPWIAGLGLTGAIAAVAMARARPGGGAAARGAVRIGLLTWGWAAAVTLIVLIPDQRVLTTIAYTPVGLVGIPLGWPDLSYGEFFGLAYPWTTINLMVCAGGGVAWAMASVSYQRRTIGACGRCGRRGGRAARWTTPGAARRWGRWATYTAAIMPLAYAVVRWAWALGIPLTISRDFLEEMHETGMVWAGAYLATFAAVGGILTLGLVHRWGEIWPRWVLGLAGRPVPRAFPIVFAGTVAVSLASAGAVMTRIVDWSRPADVLSNPMLLWPLWSVALGAATLAYHVRTRGSCRVCGGGRVPGSAEIVDESRDEPDQPVVGAERAVE